MAGEKARRVIIAIDGPAGAGKSTIARRLAARLGFTYIDTGAMYRAVGLWALRQGLELSDAPGIQALAQAAAIELEPGGVRVWLNGDEVTEAIRTPEISQAASVVSAIPGVRRAMVEKQRAMGERSSAVMEGRDIGTVVFPDAELKVFLDARPEERVRRRVAESEEKGQAVSLEYMNEEMRRRDERDRSRAEAPLKQAPDAVYLDSTGRSIDEVEEAVLRLVRECMAKGKESQ